MPSLACKLKPPLTVTACSAYSGVNLPYYRCSKMVIDGVSMDSCFKGTPHCKI